MRAHKSDWIGLFIGLLLTPAISQAAMIGFDYVTTEGSGSLTINTLIAPPDSDASISRGEYSNETTPAPDSGFVSGGGFANATSADLVQIDLGGGVNTVFVSDMEAFAQTSLSLTFFAGSLFDDSLALTGLSGANILFGFLITSDEFGIPSIPVDVTSVSIRHSTAVPLPSAALLFLSGFALLRSRVLRRLVSA